MNTKELDMQWEDYVNSFLFANYKNLTIWITKRGVSSNDLIYNYIDFPIPENGKILTKELLNFIIQSIENDEKLCNQIFGPAYELHTAKILYKEDEEDSLLIIWNTKKYDEINSTKEFNDLYHWSISYK